MRRDHAISAYAAWAAAYTRSGRATEISGTSAESIMDHPLTPRLTWFYCRRDVD